MTEDSRSEKKFAHLLQPIRSLSDNWDIDLAAELEEYLVLCFIFSTNQGIISLRLSDRILVVAGGS